MKSLTNKFILSVLSLVLTGVALSVGVYAWFTINNTASIEQFSASVQTGEGFYVSLDATDNTSWRNTITTTEIQTEIGAVTFLALTSEDGMVINDFDGDPAASGAYIEFDLYFVGSANLNYVVLTSLTLDTPEAT